MKTLWILLLGIFLFEAHASDNSIKAKKMATNFISEEKLLWDGSPDTKYFQITDETIIRESLYCTDYDSKISYCVLTTSEKGFADWKVKGLIFFVEPAIEVIHRFSFITEDNQ